MLVVLHHKLLLLYIIHHLLSGRGLGQFGYQPQDENQASSCSLWRVSQGLRRHHSLRCRDRRSRYPKWLGYSRSSQCCSCWNHDGAVDFSLLVIVSCCKVGVLVSALSCCVDEVTLFSDDSSFRLSPFLPVRKASSVKRSIDRRSLLSD